MSTKKQRAMFVTLPVRDVKKSMAFFTALGFEFNPQFTSETSACIVINEGVSVMLASDAFFKTLASKEPCDTRTHVEALFAVELATREEVDAIVKNAVEAGGKAGHPPEDLGFMYSSAFYDLDGHSWGPFWTNPVAQ